MTVCSQVLHSFSTLPGLAVEMASSKSRVWNTDGLGEIPLCAGRRVRRSERETKRVGLLRNDGGSGAGCGARADGGTMSHAEAAPHASCDGWAITNQFGRERIRRRGPRKKEGSLGTWGA